MDISHIVNNSPPYSGTALSYLTDDQQRVLNFLECVCKSICKENLTVVNIEGVHYLIGAQIAKLIKAATSNIYRSLRRMGIDTLRASPSQVHEINTLELPLVGVTHSITFIKIDDALIYVIKCKLTFPPSPLFSL